ncbi:unnamed protein product [Nesidiocoris tenuis]|uniref:Uncharacterized protein n=1 Tax=Nesidiocoris tenuis TaxID=355587 RepID=A0A6H5H5X5_9HEMI|nr:unnamed protein product [Nesidiocoris tenuis]
MGVKSKVNYRSRRWHFARYTKLSRACPAALKDQNYAGRAAHVSQHLCTAIHDCSLPHPL